MSRKNELVSTDYKGIKELTTADGHKHYIAIFTHLGKRYGERNFTKLFGSKTAKKAYDKLQEVKLELSKGEDPFNRKTKKVKDLIEDSLKNKSENYKYISTKSYEKHIDPIIGHKYIERVTKEDIEKIRDKMMEKGLKASTLKKVRTILTNVFNTAYEEGKIKINPLKLVPMGKDIRKPSLHTRLNDSSLDAVRKIYNTILKRDDDLKLLFLISVMCARRFGEIYELQYEDIVDGIVHVKAGTTKTYKDYHDEEIVERYPLPKEALQLLKEDGTGNIFTQRKRLFQDGYKDMIDKDCNLDFKPLAKEYPIRTHDNRNFMISICAKKYGVDFVGNITLSHSNKSDMNRRYLNIELDDIIEVYNYYWSKLRGS